MPNRLLNVVNGFVLQSYYKAEEGLAVAAKNKYDYWYIDGSIHSDFVSEWNKDRINNLLVEIDKHKVKPIYHGNYKLPLASDVEDLRLCAVNYIKKEIDLCQKLNCPLIVHGSVIVEPRKVVLIKKLSLENLVISLEELTDYANKRDVKIYLENLSNYPNYRPFSYIATTVDEFSFLLSRIDVSIYFDAGHANVNAQCSVTDFFNHFHRNIVGISLSNNNGQQDQHLKLEEGTIDILALVKSILDANWRGLVGFETRNATPQQSIQTLHDYANSLS